MELYLLRTFVTAARLSHLTRAAEKLHLTQPAVSGHIKALERELGVLLFDRKPGQVQLTPVGEVFLDDAERVLAAAGQLAERARQLRGEVSGAAVIGVWGEAELLRLGPWMSRVRSEFPLLQLRARTMLSGEIPGALLAGDLTAGFYAGIPGRAELRQQILRTLVYRVCLPKVREAEAVRGGWKLLASQPWVSAPTGSHEARLLRDLFAERGLRPTIAVENDDPAALTSLLRANVGVALLPEERAFALVERGDAAIWPHARIEVPLVFTYAAMREDDAVLIGMLSVLRQLWSSRDV